MEALGFLRGHPSVEEAAVFGTSLHVSAAPDDADPEVWRRRVTGAGIRVSSVELVPPSMEDVFVALVAEVDRELAGETGG